MKSQEFPQCCGMKILSEFGHTTTAVVTTKYTRDEIKEFIVNDRGVSFTRSTIQVISLNEQQLKSIGRDLFVELGFKISEPMYYPGHGNNLFILTYNPNGSKPE
jgi:hypothetical protein